MKIQLVTGVTGFLGSRLARALIHKGNHVIGLMREGSPRQNLQSCALEDQVELCTIDPLNFNLADILHDRPFETVYHTASLSRVGESPADIKNLIESNITFPVMLAKQAKDLGGRSFINASTSWQSIDGQTYSPFNLYAASKQSFEDFLTALASPAFACISLRLFDTYGVGDTRGKIVDLLLKTAFAGSQLAMSPGQQKMSLVHIEDVVQAFIKAGELAVDGSIMGERRYCINATTPIALRDLAETIGELSGKNVAIEWGGRPYRPNEVMFPHASHPCVPEWMPCMDLRDGLKEMIEDYKTKQ